MKIFVMVSDQSSLIINDGFPVAQRFHKDKETGDKKFYPVGTYNVDKARSQYFFLNKALQDRINEEDLHRIDNLTFKEHNNIPGLQIAFPSRKESKALLVFDGYRRDDIIFIEDRDFIESPCPYNSKVSRSYHCRSEADSAFHCAFCDERGEVARTEEDVIQISKEMGLEGNIKPKKLINKFFHLFHGDVRIYKEATSITVEEFLDTFAVTVEDGQTVQFLMNKKTKDPETGLDVEKQYLIEFTYNVDQKPNVTISLLEERGFTKAQYDNIVQKAENFMNALKQTPEQKEVNTQSIFYFPDKADEYESSPFAGLKDMVDPE